MNCTHVAARAVDLLSCDHDSKVLNISSQTVLARLVSIVAFPILAIVDASIYFISAFFLSLAAPFSDKAAQFAKKQFALFGKSLLGAIASPLGLLSPDIVTYHFLHKPHLSEQQVKDFGQINSTQVSLQKMPSTVEEVRDLVQKAKDDGLKIGVAGAQLAQGGHTLPSEHRSIFISTKNLNRVVVDKSTRIATVGAGATWEDIQEVAHKQGLAIQVMQASNIFSVGGSLSTNVHGWDHQMGSLINTVKSITIVDANGDIRKLDKDSQNQDDKNLFNSVIGGYGLFGIIIEAELELANDDVYSRQAEVISLNQYATHFKEDVQGKDDIALHYGRLSLDPRHLFEKITSVKYIKGTEKDYQKPKQLKMETRGGSAVDRIMVHTLRRLKIAKYLKQLIDNKTYLPSIMTSRNETMRPNIRFIEHPSKADADMLQEYFVPQDKLECFLMDMKKIAQDNQINLMNATIRYVKKDEQSTLAYAREHCFAIVIYFNQSLALHQLRKMECWTQELVKKSLECQGSFYLPYHRFPTVDQFHTAYPSWDHFMKQKKQYDPRETFSSQFYTHYFGKTDPAVAI